MRKKERFDKIIDYFEKNMAGADTELEYGSPFQLLVAVILSAQCTDKRVNMVTPALFKDYPTAEAMAEASLKAFTASPKQAFRLSATALSYFSMAASRLPANLTLSISDAKL